MEKIIFKDFENVVPMIKDRWTPIYLEHGRLEVDNYSIKWVSEIGEITKLPIAMLSCICLGPGSTVTHSVIVACSKVNTPIVWCGEDGIYFYSVGVNVNERCKTSIRHSEAYNVDRLNVCRNMFKFRFKDVDCQSLDISSMMGIEGNRIKTVYKELSEKYKIPWACRNTNGVFGVDVDALNLSLNILNYHLYSLCLSVITTMGYLPQLGFFHSDGKIPFVYDIADLYKVDLSFDVAFKSFSEIKTYNKEYLTKKFCEKVAEYGLMKKLPKHLHEIMS